MKELWKKLIDCGNKSVGTPEKLHAEELLFQALHEISPEAYKSEFVFDGWGVSGSSYISLTEPVNEKLESLVFMGSGRGSFSGTVRYIGKNMVWNMYSWDRYAVFDNNSIVAYITGRPEGGVLSQTLVEGNSSLPHFILGADGNARLKKLLSEGIVAVAGRSDTFRDTAMRGCNLILPLNKNESGKKIILCAHYDTMYNTPGAYDNAAGVAVVAEAVRQLAARHFSRNIEIILFDAEENRLEGSQPGRCDGNLERKRGLRTQANRIFGGRRAFP